MISWPASTSTGRVTALDHEGLDDAVERGVVVKALARQEDEVIHRLGCLIGKQLDDDVALAGLQPRLVLLLWVNCHRRWGLVLFSHRSYCNESSELSSPAICFRP